MPLDPHEIASSVETAPRHLSIAELGVLCIDNLDFNLADIIEDCSRECALGESNCKLQPQTIQHRPESLSFYVSCHDCPNPELAQVAVASLVDFAERRIEAARAVPFKQPEAREESVDKPFFREIEGPWDINPRLHLISAESLDQLVDSEGVKSRLPATLLLALGKDVRQNYHFSERARTAISVSDYDAKKFGSRTQVFIVAENMDWLLAEEEKLKRVDNIGPQSLALLHAAYQKVIEAGFAPPPEKRHGQGEAAGDSNPHDSIEIEELDLAPRAYRTLKQAGVQTLGELRSKTERELKMIPQMGQVSLTNIEGALLSRGLSLAEEPSNQ